MKAEVVKTARVELSPGTVVDITPEQFRRLERLGMVKAVEEKPKRKPTKKEV